MEDQNISSEDLVSQLLGNYANDTLASVKLPSGEEVRIKAMRFEDEKDLINESVSTTEATNLLIERCVVADNIEELLLPDKLYAIFKIRELSFGDAYSFTSTCQKCAKSGDYSISISDLPINYMEEGLTEVTVKLPLIGKEAVVTLATLSDEKYFSSGDTIVKNLWRFIKSIDNIDNTEVISKVVKKLPAGDIKVLTTAISGSDYGLPKLIGVKCSNCGHQQEVRLPINANFFSTV